MTSPVNPITATRESYRPKGPSSLRELVDESQPPGFPQWATWVIAIPIWVAGFALRPINRWRLRRSRVVTNRFLDAVAAEWAAGRESQAVQMLRSFHEQWGWRWWSATVKPYGRVYGPDDLMMILEVHWQCEVALENWDWQIQLADRWLDGDSDPNVVWVARKTAALVGAGRKVEARDFVQSYQGILAKDPEVERYCLGLLD